MIKVERLSKDFGPVMAVQNVSFNVEANEIVGLLGNNGAGKTTIIRILTTFLAPTRGTARVAGFDVMSDAMEVRRRVGYLPESIPLYPEMRVEEYLTFRAKIKGVDRKARPGQIARCLERCRIREVHRRLLGSLSKGYRQRVGLADAMLNDPPILILDEPTDGLDPGQKTETLSMLGELGRDHTIMLSSHLLTEVETIAQRVIILRRGQLGMARKLADLEQEAIILLEVRGPAEQVANALRSSEGVASVTFRPVDDGITAFEVRTQQYRDLREALARRVTENHWSLRRLDLRRRSLQDRWNEINNLGDYDGGGSPAVPSTSLAGAAVTR
jgi:ABC-2 type transport system ATP-binding protein